MKTQQLPTRFEVGDITWVRSYNTRRSGLGEILAQYTREDGIQMATVRLLNDCYDWDNRNALIVGTAGKVLEVELYRLEQLVV